ncbi:hypothetical protein CC1G_03206 [Coprinopsis cinerea okayama7|uniref:E3 ubiquitin protein ligase n=1 Tax=Coprinopsis cinerea (strain Okayama-7 / 130 / ATCC MYA-4618 / FGSC 9003) TaxID=240176 RepID=A8N763_COPC7|nr:hypothetical protein CC1G_03206 [Coprinopsis cinerea okayama7\|eukprot:XP_001830669.2 hypothetical protein CC1G_03206 [Coprinopsis cinerea okayama7\
MESRKRPHTDDGDVSVAKKRVLTGSNGTPHVNGPNDQTEDEQVFQAGLENFRKEAIYRRMKHYSRENERNLARIEDLERRKETCEAGLAAMSACWAQLIETIRLLIHTDNLPENHIKGKDIFDLSSRLQEETTPALKSAIGEAAKATEALVAKFATLAAEQKPEILRNDTFQECQRAQTECAALQSDLQLTRQQLQDCINERDKYHNELIATQNRIERSQSRTVLAVESRQPSSTANSVNGDAEDTQRKPSSPSESPKPSSNAPENAMATDAPPELLQLRENKIVELEKEVASLKARAMVKEAEYSAVPMKALEENVVYRALVERCNDYKQQATNLQEELSHVREENHNLKAMRADWESKILGHLKAHNEELKSTIAKRDAENTRLREQRDQQQAELNERKHKDGVKINQINELKNLVEQRKGQICILQSEIRRCKARLAANERQEDLMKFFLGAKDDPGVVDYVKSLEQEKKELSARADALNDALSRCSETNPDVATHINAHAEAEEKLKQVTSELTKFKQVFGDLQSLPPDTAELAARLQTQSEEIERLRLLNKQYEQSEAGLYEEIEKLSTAWESFDKQLSNKVFDLANMEERLQKSVVEKAKSDNKYFSAMREKEAIDMERKNLQRVLEKQGKALDRFAEVDKSVKAMQDGLQKSLATAEKAKDACEAHNRELQAQLAHAKTCLQLEKASLTTLSTLIANRDREWQVAAERMRRAEDDYYRAKKQAQQEIQRMKEEAAARVVHKHGSGSKDDAEYQHLRSLLLCSTCGTNFRSVIITKCMHSSSYLFFFDAASS